MATDTYQPDEGQYQVTRREMLAERRNPANLTTKGRLVARDFDMLQELKALPF